MRRGIEGMRGAEGEGGRVVHRRPKTGPRPTPPHYRYSGDYSAPPPPGPSARFRRARSSEWDQELGAGAGEGSCMRTLDKRVSVSSEQLDGGAGRWGALGEGRWGGEPVPPAPQPQPRRTPFEVFLEDDGPYSR